MESLVEGLVERTIKPTEIALKDAGLKTSDVDEVILVGGQTRMPLVQEKVKSFFWQRSKKGYKSLMRLFRSVLLSKVPYLLVMLRTYFY